MKFKGMIIMLVVLLAGMTASAQYRTDAVYDDLYDGETVSALKMHVRELSSAHLEGRKPGSEGEKEAAEYGQGGLVCCSPWGCKESDTTQ